MLFPAFKYQLKGIVLEQALVNPRATSNFNGEITLQEKGVITGGLTFTKEGVEAEYKKQADAAFHDLFTKADFKIDKGKAEVSLCVGATLMSGNRVLATTESSIVPPDGVKYTFKGQEAKGDFREFEFGGILGYELALHYVPEEPKRVSVYAAQWSRVAGVALLAGAAVIVIADAVKDVGTGGVGAVESPLSWSAAAALFSKGAGLLRTAP